MLIGYFLDCICKDLVYQGKLHRWGNCTQGFCYVEQPSTCADLNESKYMPEEQMSYQACSEYNCLDLCLKGILLKA